MWSSFARVNRWAEPSASVWCCEHGLHVRHLRVFRKGGSHVCLRMSKHVHVPGWREHGQPHQRQTMYRTSGLFASFLICFVIFTPQAAPDGVFTQPVAPSPSPSKRVLPPLSLGTRDGLHLTAAKALHPGPGSGSPILAVWAYLDKPMKAGGGEARSLHFMCCVGSMLHSRSQG